MAALFAVLVLAGCIHTPTDGQRAAAQASPRAVAVPTVVVLPRIVVSTALRDLEGLRTVPDGDVPGYDRCAQFGCGWRTVPGTGGCDARQVLVNRVIFAPLQRLDACRVTAGNFTNPYNSVSTTYVQTRDLDVDHLVSLHDAWNSGASGPSWEPTRTSDRRKDYANDPDVMVLTDKRTNRSKGDRGPDEWNPLREDDTCVWMVQYVEVKDKWDLGVTGGQRRTLKDTLTGCLTKAR